MFMGAKYGCSCGGLVLMGAESSCICEDSGVGGVTFYIWHSRCACQMAPFFSAARYMIGPLFSAKSI